MSDDTWTRIRRKVAAEIREARKRGDHWTRLRAFLPGERLGKAWCCVLAERHAPTRSTVCVQYSTGLPGAIAYCEKHARRAGFIPADNARPAPQSRGGLT